MDFSEEWKSGWTISSIFEPPLLISRPSSKSLGPLLFTPSPNTSNLLLSSPYLSSPFTLPPLSFPRGKPREEETPTFNNNNLQMLKCSNNDFLLFFPFGDDLNRVGFVKISVNGSKPQILNVDDGILETEEEFVGRVRKILVSSAVGECLDFLEESGNSVIIGFLLACSVDSVHWYKVEIVNTRWDFGKPALAYLGTKEFSHSVVHACWNPHLPEESLVLLENGDLFVFDLGYCASSDKFPVNLEGTRIRISWEDFDLDSGEGNGKKVRWLSCGYSWNPRISVVACSCAVFLVDWRFVETNVSILAKIEMLHLNRTIRNSQFIAFCITGSDGFYFTVATEDNLFLIDIRKPMMPVLQWAHGLDNPHYINVFKLSDLRATMKEYKGAFDSGFAILLGSFLNSKFRMFCYGPPLPAPYESVASKVSEFCNSLYAWELPLEISLLNRQCNCGDCLLVHDFSNAALPKWKKERLLGFCIIGEDLLDPQPESDGSSGFVLMRLVSSGKLESQKYCASCDFISLKLEGSREKSPRVEDSLLDLFIDQTYKFPRRFRYLHLDSLFGFMNGNLPKVLMSKMKKICVVSNKTMPYTKDSSESICDILKAAGVDSIGFCPAIKNVLNDISWPMNILEITSSRMWGGLNVDLLQLAFTIYSELVGVLVEHRKISFEALDIPILPQLPPFFSKIPTSRSNKWSWNLQLDDVLVGPMLPLPYLLSLHKVEKDNNCLILEDEENDEVDVAQQCNKVMIAASEMALPGFLSEINDAPAVSLANDREEKWVPSKELKPIFFLKPSSSSEKKESTMDTTPLKSVYEDEKFDIFISKTREKDNTSNPMKEPVGLDVFDDMCPIELNFDFPEMNFGVNEWKGYKLLKRQFSKWHKEFRQYQDFCESLKIQKGTP